jgi:predicted CopG family antitoxin
MSKTVMLSEDAYAALLAHKKGKESFSDLVKRLAPPPIKTFGDLEKYLETLEGPLFSDMEMLRRVRGEKTGREF